MSQQASKRARAVLAGRMDGVKLSGKRYAHQRQHRRKVAATPEGLVEHVKRAYRRPRDRRGRHKRQVAQWHERDAGD